MMNIRQNIPLEMQERAERELESGESIRWIEQPIPRYFTPVSTGAFLFAIPWTAFAVFWIFGASGFKMPDFNKVGENLFPLFGLPFVLIGLGMLSSPFWSYRNALKTLYVITDRRAILFIGGRTTTIRSFLPNQLQNVYRKEKRDGSGDVIIESETCSEADNEQHIPRLGFMNIRDSKTVEKMLHELGEHKGA